MLSGSGQRCHILTEILAELLLVVVADDDCLEVGSIAETLLVDLQNAVVADAVESGLNHWLKTWMMAIEDSTDRVIIIYLGRSIAIS